MTPPREPAVVSRQELSALEDLTHDLCNFITALIYHVTLLPGDPLAPEFERVTIITGITAKIEHTLKELLMIWGNLQDSPATRTPASKTRVTGYTVR